MNPLDFLAGATSIQGLATAAPELFRRGFIVGIGLLLVIAGLVFVVSGTKAGQAVAGVASFAIPGANVAKVASVGAKVAGGASKAATVAKGAAAAAKGA